MFILYVAFPGASAAQANSGSSPLGLHKGAVSPSHAHGNVSPSHARGNVSPSHAHGNVSPSHAHGDASPSDSGAPQQESAHEIEARFGLLEKRFIKLLRVTLLFLMSKVELFPNKTADSAYFRFLFSFPRK